MRIPQLSTDMGFRNDKHFKNKQRFKNSLKFTTIFMGTAASANTARNKGKGKDNEMPEPPSSTNEIDQQQQDSLINVVTNDTSYITASSMSSSPAHHHHYDSPAHTQAISSNATPRTVAVLNNNNNHLLNNLSLNDHIDYDYIAHPRPNDSLEYSYNKNTILINNNKYIQSFSSLNSSLDTSSSPPISRSSSPLRFSILNQAHLNHPNTNLIDSLLSANSELFPQVECIKKRKIEYTTATLSNTSFIWLALSNTASGQSYELQLSPFNEDRLKLIKNLALKEFMNYSQTNSVLDLFKSSKNLTLKLKLLKSIINLPDDSIYLNKPNLADTLWSLKFKMNLQTYENASDDYYHIYKTLMLDIISLLSLMHSIASYVVTTNNNPNLVSELDILSFYYNSLSFNDIADIKNNCPLKIYNSNLLEKFVYLLWKTEDSFVCSQFRQLFN